MCASADSDQTYPADQVQPTLKAAASDYLRRHDTRRALTDTATRFYSASSPGGVAISITTPPGALQ
jgi:hypothetical protein